MKGKTKYILFAVLAILIITNPSQKDFKEYLGVTDYHGLKRKVNFFIGSIYTGYGNSYFGILGNFIQTSHKDPFVEFGGHETTSQPIDSTEKVDSAVIQYDTTKLLPPPPKDPLHILEKRK